MITIDIRKSKKIDSDYSLFISFPYDTKIINVIRDLPIRHWSANEKEWETPIESLSEILRLLPSYNYEITGKYVALKQKCEDMTLPSEFQFKTKPFNHQIDGFNYGLSHNKWFLGDEQGLGKTKQVIDICVAKKLQFGYRHCLIICGVNGLKWNWFNEIHTHSNEEAHILGMKTVKGKMKVGYTTDKLNDLKYISGNESESLPYFLITNVESLRDDNIASEIASLCSDGVIGVVAIDEIHKCFDYNTLVTTDIGRLKIGDIVKDQISCSVLSYNEISKETEWKRIVDWHENVIAEQLLELQIDTKNGIKTIKCTRGHKFFTTNRGWVRAEDLTSYDDIQEV